MFALITKLSGSWHLVVLEDVAEITGYSRNWIYELVWGYNRVGPETLGDGRVDNPGEAPLLDDIQQANLWHALKGSAPDGGRVEWA